MSGERAPLLRVLRGRPDDAELAAVTATVLALTTSDTGAGSRPESTRHAGGTWRGPGWRRRQGAWRAAGRPAA